jgi:hypothetical protein
MRRHIKVKSTSNRVLVRKSVTSGSAAARRNFPAWVDSAEGIVVFTTGRTATPRVRDGLVLRRVDLTKFVERSVAHGSSSR